MNYTCDHCGMPYATLYVLATGTNGEPILSHSMCDGCAMTFSEEAAESDGESVVETDGSIISSSEGESDDE